MGQKSKLEEKLFKDMKFFNIPEPVRQWRFHPTRMWRFDFTWVGTKVAVEVQGGVFMGGGGGHNRGASMHKDWKKHNEATKLGWRIFYFGPKDINPKSTEPYSQAIDFLYKFFVSGGGVNGPNLPNDVR